MQLNLGGKHYGTNYFSGCDFFYVTRIDSSINCRIKEENTAESHRDCGNSNASYSSNSKNNHRGNSKAYYLHMLICCASWN